MVTLSAFADEISPNPIEQLDCLESVGVRHIEFRSIHGTNVLDLSDEQHAEFRALLDARGIGLSAIGSPIGKIPITESFPPHLERFGKAIELAEFYKTPRIRVFSFYIPEGEDPAPHRDEVMRRIRAMASVAESRGVTLFLENERAIYGDTAARVQDVLATIDSPSLGHAFDPANYLEIGQSIDEAWALLKPRVIHFHVKDYDTTLKRNVPAGQGQGQIPELIADAVAAGYSGFCTLEPHLKLAERMYGFTGPDRFGEAARALQAELYKRGIAYE